MRAAGWEQNRTMKMWLIRHGETDYNTEHRYQGQIDIPLSEEGRNKLCPSPEKVDRVYVSRLKRTGQTAEILFPDARQIAVPGLEEMNFGRFDGHTHQELGSDPAYQRWIDSWCTTDIPGGENREQFTRRIIKAVTGLIRENVQAGEKHLVIVAHGGTLMAFMEKFGNPKREYYEWQPENGDGWELEVETEGLPEDAPVCHVLGKLSFRR